MNVSKIGLDRVFLRRSIYWGDTAVDPNMTTGGWKAVGECSCATTYMVLPINALCFPAKIVWKIINFIPQRVVSGAFFS